MLGLGLRTDQVDFSAQRFFRASSAEGLRARSIRTATKRI